MSIFSCVSWVGDLCVQLYQGFSPTATVKRDVPYQIVADILVRLPAEYVYFCWDVCTPLRTFMRTTSFALRQFSRSSTPTIAFQNYYFSPLSSPCVFSDALDPRVQSINTHFLADNLGRKILTRNSVHDFTLACPKEKKCVPFLYGSHHGFLMLKNIEFDNVLVLWNPLTKEKVSVIAPDGCHQPHGFFFHENEYKVLFMSTKTTHFEFNLLGLRTKFSRMITRFNHPPSGIASPVILNGCLHWIICDRSYKKVNGGHPCCSNSIVIFDVHTEEVRTMAHPGAYCHMALMNKGYNRHSQYMKLMEDDGSLCLCNYSLCGKLVFWVLRNSYWSQKYVIDLKLSYRFCHEQLITSKCMHIQAEGMNVYHNNLLLIMIARELFIYPTTNMPQLRYPIIAPKLELPITSVLHVDTLLSLEADPTVYLDN